MVTVKARHKDSAQTLRTMDSSCNNCLSLLFHLAQYCLYQGLVELWVVTHTVGHAPMSGGSWVEPSHPVMHLVGSRLEVDLWACESEFQRPAEVSLLGPILSPQGGLMETVLRAGSRCQAGSNCLPGWGGAPLSSPLALNAPPHPQNTLLPLSPTPCTILP